MNARSTSPLDRLARNLEFGGGRYALYPPPRAFTGFTDAQFTAAINASNGDPIPPQLALHFDIPAAYRSSFCHADAPLDAGDRAHAHAYRDRLVREVGLVGGLFDRDRDVVGVSLAPGMTRWMAPAQVAELLESLGRHFHVHRHGIDLAMTLDLDDTGTPPLHEWAELGFNRVSISLAAIAGTRAPTTEVARHVERARNGGFANLRVEVPYGLPDQSAATFASLVQAAIAAGPERIGLRHRTRPEHDEAAPESPSRLHMHACMLLAGADALEAAGYVHVGVDLFARPNDPLVIAQRHQRLHRDALGFGVHGVTHLVGFGVGAISQLGGSYSQNPLDLPTWEARIDRGARAVQRGVDLQQDDDVRADVLQGILCYGRIDTARLEHHHHLGFREYFANELQRLGPLFEDGTLRWDADAIILDRTARLASRSIAAHFDPQFAVSACAPFAKRAPAGQ